MTNYLTISLFGALMLSLAGCQSTDSPAGDNARAGGLTSLLGPALAPVDSLNGVPGLTLGRPLDAFPGLKLSEGPQGAVSMYQLGDSTAGVDNAWLKANRAAVPGQFLGFRSNQLVRIQLVAYSPAGQQALREYTDKLFGKGRLIAGRMEWSGQRAGAVLENHTVYGRTSLVLDVMSMDAAK